jgi:hypothetical protein
MYGGETTATGQAYRAPDASARWLGVGGELTARSLHCLGAVAVGNERRPKQTHSLLSLLTQAHTPPAHNKIRERGRGRDTETNVAVVARGLPLLKSPASPTWIAQSGERAARGRRELGVRARA